MTRSREVQARGWRKLALACLYPVRVLAGGKHPSLTVRSTSYLGKVARDALAAIRGTV